MHVFIKYYNVGNNQRRFTVTKFELNISFEEKFNRNMPELKYPFYLLSQITISNGICRDTEIE